MKQQPSSHTNHFQWLSKIGVGKYKLPAILNGIAIRFVNICNKISLKLAKVAFALNSSQLHYYHNLTLVEKCTDSIENIIQPKYIKTPADLLDIKTWCTQQKLPFETVKTDQSIFIAEPKLIAPPSRITHTGSGHVRLPKSYIANIDDATVIAGSSLVLTNQDRIALSDEVYAQTPHHYCLKTPYINYTDNDNAVIKYIKKMKAPVQEAIHFCNDYSHNYYHWLIECLPRLFIIDQFAKLDQLPLLIDDGLFPQQLEALKILNTNKHPLIPLKKGYAYEIEKLTYPSMLTIIHDNYHSPVAFDKDVLISPTAIHYVRNKILNILGCSTQRAFRKLFISRKKSSHRRLVNLEEIESLMIARGFEIVYPETLSFTNQVKLFTQAKLVIGQTGAGLANLMFCPENCKAIILINHHPQTNYYLFSNLAQILNIDLQFIPGSDVIEHVDNSLQNDFVISKDILSTTIDSLIV